MPDSAETTRVTFPSGVTHGTSTVVQVVEWGEGSGIITAETPFHPVDHTWPDQPADVGTLSIAGQDLQVHDCVTGGRSLASNRVALGADIEIELTADVASDDAVVVAGPSGDARLPGCVMSFAYWDPRILRATRLLNSQTGELLPVSVAEQGTERVNVAGRTVAATRHRLSAPDLQIDLWYADGRWVALEAPTPGGRTLRYEL